MFFVCGKYRKLLNTFFHDILFIYMRNSKILTYLLQFDQCGFVHLTSAERLYQAIVQGVQIRSSSLGSHGNYKTYSRG